MARRLYPAVLILAGGLGSRLGHVDKASLRLSDQPERSLLERALERYDRLGPLYVANGAHAAVDIGAARCLPDPPDVAPHSGPLAGVLAGLRQAHNDRLDALLVCPVDLLAPSATCLRALLQTLSCNLELDGVRASRDGQPEPLVSAWRVSDALLASALAELQSGQRSVRRWQARLSFNDELVQGSEAPWRNLNTPEDLLNWQRSRGAG